MKIHSVWSQPIPMKKRKGSLTYDLDLEKLPKTPGVYVFARTFDGNVAPIYVGESVNVQARVKGHLNSVKLMEAITKYPNGERILLFCNVKTRSPAMAKKQVKIVERALILHAQSEGFELVNKQGTKLPTHTISFSGNRTSEALAPRTVLIKSALATTRKRKSSAPKEATRKAKR